jgi:hypothetical protein
MTKQVKAFVRALLLLMWVGTAPAAIPTATGDLQAYLEGIDYGVAEDGRFKIPTPDQQIKFGQVVLLILQGNYGLAHEWAAELGFEVVAWTDTRSSQLYYLLRELNPIPSPLANGGGWYVFRPSATYNVAIRAPHPVHDMRTGLEAITTFMASDARYLMLAGTHRRSHPDPSTCQDFQDYRPSDAVHNAAHYYFVAHRVMEDFDPRIHYVELHGYGSAGLEAIASQCDTGGNLAVIEMSETLPDVDADGYTLMHVLHSIISNDGEFVSCIYSPVLDTGPGDKYSHHYGATTNVPGRYTNGSPSVCDTPALTEDNTHRFLHLEQSWEIRSSTDNREKMAAYINQAISDYYDNRPFEINAGLNDAWYYPVTDGQGFFITVFPDLEKVSLSWFTYDTDHPPLDAIANFGYAGHRWATALGRYSGNQAVMNIKIASGGLFDTPAGEAEVTQVRDGTIVLTFDSCNSGTVEYDIPSIRQTGVIPIQRIAGDNIALCEALLKD